MRRVFGAMSDADAETLAQRAFADYHSGRRDRAYAYLDGIRDGKSFGQTVDDAAAVTEGSPRLSRRETVAGPPATLKSKPCAICVARLDRLTQFVNSKPFGSCRTGLDVDRITARYMRDFVLSSPEKHTCGSTNREIADFLYAACLLSTGKP